MSAQPRSPRDDVRYQRTRPRGLSTLALTVRTGLAALAASALIAAGLAWQMASGGDPALGAGAQSGEQDKRRVVQTTVIRRVGDPAAPATGSSSGSASPSAPVISAPAPVTSSTS